MDLYSHEADIDKHFDINQVINKVFYKYVNIEDAKLILGNKTLMFSNPSKFNDPLDCYEGFITYNYTNTELKQLVKQYVEPSLKDFSRKGKREYLNDLINHPTKFKSMQNKLILDMKAKIGVCCFSEIHKNILMWSHYAKNHTGICIGFTLPPVQEGLFAIYPVMYKEKIVGINRTMSYLNAMRQWVLIKASDWAYEKEYRAVSMKWNGLMEITASNIVEVYFGCKIEPKDKKDIIQLMKADLNHVKKYQMEINKNTFGLTEKADLMSKK